MGSLLDVEFSTLDIYYRYHATTSAGTDTTYVGMARVAATEEVLQNTSVTTQIPDGLLAESNPYTLLKSPAGAYTEMTIPVDDILGGEHATDSLNSAQLILDRYNGDEAITSPFALEAPANVLMLPKADLYTFFEQSYLPDNITSFMAQYSNGAYAFNNIALLVTTLQARRDQGAGITPADTEAQRAAKAATYAEANPDWNKVIILPVDADYTTVKTAYSSSSVLTRVRNALTLSTVRLVGGSGVSPQIRAVYSRFN